ncbi:twin-arginine translocase subunit TatC [Salinirubellus sp. GCM10025818]|uniref:twin-arginine translocase subunit TatC n=1 Tax=Salinirubellus TaxID=2162630 RepID=UPI0030CC42CE
MGDEVPDEGADDAPDPASDEEPPAREDEPADPSESDDAGTETENGDGEPSEAGWESADDWESIGSEDQPEASDPEAPDEGDAPAPAGTVDAGGSGDDHDADDGGDTGGTDDPDDPGSERPDENTPAESSPVMTSFGESSGGDDDGDDSTEVGSESSDGGDEEDGTTDPSEIPDDYDPAQPPVDVDYGAQQYTGPDDDDSGESSDEDTGESSDEIDTEFRQATDPDSVTEEWVAEDAVPAATADETSAAKSDGGYADGTGAVGGYETPTEEELFEGPASDQEMPLADHIEEMIRRLGVVLIVMAIVSGIVFPFGERIINFLWYSVLVADPVPQPRVYHPLALILARLKVATLAGFIVALPVFVYESYQFMKPGLYPHERRYYLASVPTSLVLATVGVLFAYFLVLPALFTYFLYYSDEVTVIAFGLTETFDLMVLMLGGFAFIFQIPLFVMLAIMMGLTTRQWMADRRLYFWGAFLGLAFLFSPDPTGMAPIIVAATMVVLFEGTLFLLKWTNRGREQVSGG